MQSSQNIVCPLCNDAVDKLLYRFHIDCERRILDRIKEAHPGWTAMDGVCSRSMDHYHTEIVMEQRILPGIGPHFSIKSADDFVILPTGIRLNANPAFTGKGVTICFIDSGFFAHPDLVVYRNCIKVMIDVTVDKNNQAPDQVLPTAEDSERAAWHGPMTTVVCAGDGWLCNGYTKPLPVMQNWY
jgi:serine protease AprX